MLIDASAGPLPVTKELKGGEIVHVLGIPVRLSHDVAVITTEGNWGLIEEYRIEQAEAEKRPRGAEQSTGACSGKGDVAIGQEEWLRRYQQRFIEVARITPEQAAMWARADAFDVLSHGFENDPEGAADSEMSYWEAD